jgi:hypothetical protein
MKSIAYASLYARGLVSRGAIYFVSQHLLCLPSQAVISRGRRAVCLPSQAVMYRNVPQQPARHLFLRRDIFSLALCFVRANRNYYCRLGSQP